MKTTLSIVALVMATSCSTGGTSRQHVQVAHLGFDVPGDWSSAETKERGLVTSVWTPDENLRKESVTVARSERSATVANAGSQVVEQLLASAQPPGARVSPTMFFTTAKGLSGVRVDASFVPPGLKATYRRVHAVLVINHSSLVHVFYTSPSAEPSLDTFNMVLDSIHEES